MPWKYGFKSIKSIVRFTFTDKRPKTFWEAIAGVRVRLLGQRQSGGAASALEPGDRGVVGTGERVPTLLFNGYGEYVAGIYKGLQNEPLYRERPPVSPPKRIYCAASTTDLRAGPPAAR